jgi:hypothetical protein
MMTMTARTTAIIKRNTSDVKIKKNVIFLFSLFLIFILSVVTCDIYLFVYGLFIGTISYLHCIALSDRMINE